MNYSNIFKQLLGLCSLVLALSACQSSPPVTRTPDTASQQAESIDSITSPLTDGNPSAALPFSSDFPLTDSSDDFRLQQAASLFLGGSPGLALDMLASIDDSSLTTDERTRKRIMQSTILLQAGGSLQAQQLLSQRAESNQPATLAAFYLILAKASVAQGQTADALSALMKRGQFLSGDDANDNQWLLWNILMLADTDQLQLIQQENISSALFDWIELAIIVQNSSPYSDTEQAVNNWRITKLSHPASNDVLEWMWR